MNADDAYAQCEQITWEQARNFAYGIRLLPVDKRRALAAVYAFARRIDDIGDGDLPAAEKSAQEAKKAKDEAVDAKEIAVKERAKAEASEKRERDRADRLQKQLGSKFVETLKP